MHRSAVVALVAFVATACGGTTIRIPMSGSPMTVGEETIDFDQDGIMDFFVGGSTLCTQDIPTSICAHLLGIRARDNIAFLLPEADAKDPLPLSPGDVVGETPSTGDWGSVPHDSVWISYVYHLLEPERSGYGAFLGDRDEYLIGFRAETEAATRFGWLDVSLYTSLPVGKGMPPKRMGWPQARALSFGSDRDEPVVVTVIPEPSTLMLLVTSALLLIGIRTPNKPAPADVEDAAAEPYRVCRAWHVACEV